MPEHVSELSRPAFERLVREHHAAVYSSALRIVRDEATALDVTQDVYLAVLSGRIVLTGDGDERVLRWFAVRSSLQAMRARENRRAREEGYAMVHADVRTSDPLEARDESSALASSIARLPESLRVPLQLRYFEDMTFDAVGDALSISGPAAHERVKRALAALRDNLSRAGFAAVATGLEENLSSAARASIVQAPPQLARQLVALHSGAAATSIASALGLAVVVVLTTVAVLTWTASTSGGAKSGGTHSAAQLASNATGAIAAADARAPQESPLVEPLNATSMRTVVPTSMPSTPVAATETPVETTGTIRGILLDDRELPVANQVVVAESIEREGKIAAYAGRGKTGRDGAFEIPVPIGPALETNYTLVLEGRLELMHRGKDEFVRAKSGKTVDAGTLHVRASLKDEPGDFTLDLEIVDARGAPIAGAVAVLSRGVRSQDGWSPRTWEAGGPSDSSGRAHFSGAHVGAKHLAVDARDQGYAQASLEFELGLGSHSRRIVLERGLEISGRLVDVQGRAVAPDPEHRGLDEDIQVHVHASGADNDWIFASIDAQGAFVVRGLDPGEYELGLGGGPWSPLCTSGVRAGTRDLVLTLKLDDDPLPHGDHCAEIHARLVDAITGQPVAADVLTSDVEQLQTGVTRAQFDLDDAPGLLWQAPVQVMWIGAYPEPSDRLRRTGLAGGTYVFIARVPGYATALSAPITLAPHALESGLVLRLVRPVAIAGRVLDIDGQPCANAFVLVNGSGPHSLERARATDLEIERTDGKPATWRQDIARTDAEGRFRFADLAPNLAYTFHALHVERDPVASASVAGTTKDGVELRFTRKR